ncbi:hypothetical protein [Flavobacterium succinicans]|uniref:Outer membrane protein beta-barrel domain-containing protein n=1 Tax=Flavobacterium succinicans TaxID=29536 RepID=A0A199XTJ1_9FLAO|nr:hypothetical protein [Flavobacterium succinicans]OAZ04732.1 hypothetical protein FLB_05800 [Flavobacterium succinicans]
MKKIMLTAIAVFGFAFANAQDGGFKVGANLGLPLGDIKDSYSLNLGVDVAYTWKVSEKFEAGFGAGYAHYLGKSIDLGIANFDIEDAGFIPVYGTAQYSLSDKFFLGLDLGYAIGVAPSGSEGGFLYQPKVGYSFGKTELFLGYKGISNNGTLSSLNLGVAFKL